MSNNELDGYYLMRAYHKDADPCAVVSDLLRENAADVCEKIVPWRWKSGGHDYIEKRITVENWLRENARTIGVDMRKENPVYFSLTVDPEYLSSWLYHAKAFSGMKVVAIPASEVDLSICSFTYGDSFEVHRNAVAVAQYDPLDPLRDRSLQWPYDYSLSRTVLNAEQLPEGIKFCGEPHPLTGRYIEVQMWDKPSMAAASPVNVPKSLIFGGPGAR